MNQINFPIKTSKKLLLDNNDMLNYLSKLSIKELITELDYSRASKNYDLEIIVMHEYYRKQTIKDLK